MVRCECGESAEILSTGLLKGTSTQCRRCAKRKCAVGEVFDQLTITGFSVKNGRPVVVCKCSCGGEVRTRPELLRLNQTNNCGCAPRGAWRGVGKISTTYFNRVKRNAEARGIPFDLGLPYLWSVYETQKGLCALTGLPIGFSLRVANPSEASLDRIDSSVGYAEGNVQWVHKDVNLMKSFLPQGRFLELCGLVVKNLT